MLMGDLAQVTQALQHGRIVREPVCGSGGGNAPYHNARAVGTEQLDLALDGLAASVDKRLIRRIAEPYGEIRFGMLETMREYALERLGVSGDGTRVRQRHADYYSALAEAAAPRLQSAEQVVWLDRLEAEHDNLRAALSWYTQDDSGAEAELQLAEALGWFWIIQGYLFEGRDWLRRAGAQQGVWYGRTR
jgi:predicted ATPase